MRRILKTPAVNAVCISLFTAFYASIFFKTAAHPELGNILYYEDEAPFRASWSGFLAAGHQAYIAWLLIALTALIVVLLLTRRRPYDDYHTSILASCLNVALVLTMIAIAVFYLMVLCEPSGIIEKFTLFVTVHWATVVLSDLVYVILCRWR